MTEHPYEGVKLSPYIIGDHWDIIDDIAARIIAWKPQGLMARCSRDFLAALLFNIEPHWKIPHIVWRVWFEKPLFNETVDPDNWYPARTFAFQATEWEIVDAPYYNVPLSGNYGGGRDRGVQFDARYISIKLLQWHHNDLQWFSDSPYKDRVYVQFWNEINPNREIDQFGNSDLKYFMVSEAETAALLYEVFGLKSLMLNYGTGTQGKTQADEEHFWDTALSTNVYRQAGVTGSLITGHYYAAGSLRAGHGDIFADSDPPRHAKGAVWYEDWKVYDDPMNGWGDTPPGAWQAHRYQRDHFFSVKRGAGETPNQNPNYPLGVSFAGGEFGYDNALKLYEHYVSRFNGNGWKNWVVSFIKQHVLTDDTSVIDENNVGVPSPQAIRYVAKEMAQSERQARKAPYMRFLAWYGWLTDNPEWRSFSGYDEKLEVIFLEELAKMDRGDEPPLPPPPTAAFAIPEGVTVNEPVTLTAAGIGQITAYQWEYGGAVVGEDKAVTLTFTDAGEHTITLTLSGPGGVDSIARVITAEAAPEPEPEPEPEPGDHASLIDHVRLSTVFALLLTHAIGIILGIASQHI